MPVPASHPRRWTGIALSKLEREQFPEQSADTDVGIEIAAAAGPVRQSFIISKLWTIEAKLHEPRERNNAARLNLAANNLTQPVHAGSLAAAHPRVVGP